MEDEPRSQPTRRQVLTAGAAALALTALPGIAAATTQPQSRPQRGRVLASLNGTWDFLPTTGTPTQPPADGTWSPIPVPAEWNMTSGVFATSWDAYDLFRTPAAWNDVDVAWYRRTFTVPDSARGRRIVLRFDAVNFEAAVSCNGVQVGRHAGGLLPFEADVTDQITWGGTNTVHVLVRSGNAAARQSDGWHHPNGSWWGQTCWGIWQDVWLLARSPVYVADSFVTTSVTDKTISVTTTLANDGPSAATVGVEHTIPGGPRSTSRATVPAGGTVTVTLDQAWPRPRLWSTTDPHLYDLTVNVRERPTGPVTDTWDVRFGFREITVRGTDVLLNGEPVMLRGDAWHYMGSVQNSRAYATAWFTMVRALGVNYLRLHAMPYPPVYYDVADELGILLVAESGIYGSSGNYALNSADFWANCADHLAARVRRDRNHPSVFAWSAENEMLAAFGQSWAARVAALKSVVTALDTTRPVYFEGDGDPQAAGDLESTHYPLEITTGGTAIPESAYALAPGQPRGTFWDRKKPMLISEFSSMYYATPSQVSAVGGPATYADLEGLWSAHALIVGAQIEGFRYAGVTGISPWNTVWYGMRQLPFDPAREKLPTPSTGPRLGQVGRWATTLNPGFERDLPAWRPNPIHDAVARVMPPTAALATDYRTHFFAGSTLTRTYAVYDEAGTQRAVTVRWTLRLAGGPTRSGSTAVSVRPDGKADVTFDVPVPTVRRTTAGSLTVTVSAGRRTLYSHAAPLTVHPSVRRTNAKPLAAAVVETTTATSDALAALGVTTRSITDLADLPTGAEVLVIGEGATVTATADQLAALTAFVHDGGRVLVLAQQTLPQLLPWPVLVSASQQTIAHVAAPHHPVLADIGADDLRWWHTTDEQVVHSALVKPRYGAFTSLADVGPGLASSALAEAPYGSGTYLFCQFPVVAATAEPIAAVLLRNLVDYLAARPSTPRARLGVVTADGSPVVTTLGAAAVDFTADPDLSDVDVLLLDGTASVDNVTAWVRAGGTLWLNDLTQAQLSAILPGVALTPLDAAHQLGAVTTGHSPIVDGLNNADLDWPGSATPLVTATVSGTGGTAAVASRGVDWKSFSKGAEQNKYQVAAESARGFTPAAVVWEKPVGKGRVVVDQLRWATGTPLPAQTAIAAGIAAGLGVGFTAGSGTGLIATTGWQGFASPNDGDAPRAYDRDETTRWSSNALQAPGMYYGLDMGATHTLTRIVWDSALSPGDLPRGLLVQTSPDGSTYTTVLTIPDTSSLSNAGVLTIPLDSVSTRYLKFVDTGSAPGNYVSLHELYLFGA
ncbi:MAG TPA: glycoside hydrolase family 2 TIM barrel-domain containing protein [Pseudonocardiaceae bacterium]|nr:glycoside hydrolase family 2 TIM barrel-domain containing protein [Pseudonocardiaceae bacterium]